MRTTAAQQPDTASFKVTKSEAVLIEVIVARACNLDVHIDRLSTTMDITACHANGCKLIFTKLLSFPDFDFMHDVYGIAQHINRRSGKIENCFMPRCAA